MDFHGVTKGSQVTADWLGVPIVGAAGTVAFDIAFGERADLTLWLLGFEWGD